MYTLRAVDGHTSVLGQTQEFSKWFWANQEDMEFISAKLGINAKKLNRILTLEQLPDEELLKGMMELCEQKEFALYKGWRIASDGN